MSFIDRRLSCCSTGRIFWLGSNRMRKEEFNDIYDISTRSKYRYGWIWHRQLLPSQLSYMSVGGIWMKEWNGERVWWEEGEFQPSNISNHIFFLSYRKRYRWFRFISFIFLSFFYRHWYYKLALSLYYYISSIGIFGAYTHSQIFIWLMKLVSYLVELFAQYSGSFIV